MKLTVCMVDGTEVTIEDFDPDTVMDLVEALRGGELLTFALDGGVTTYIRSETVARIDIE